MKWFKDRCDSLDSNFEQELILNFGGNGYLVYYGVLKMVCKEAGYNKIDGELTVEGRIIKQKLHVSLRKVEEILEFCSTKGKVFFSKTNKNFNLRIPNILEIKDNYTKDLQVTGKLLAPKKREVEVRSKKLEEPKPIVRKKDFAQNRERFEILWKSYPEKKGKEKAWLKFKNQVGTEKDWMDIQKALVSYIADVRHIQKTTHPDREFQNGATWFNNNWRDYVNLEIKSKGPGPMEQAHRGRGDFVDATLKDAENAQAVRPEMSREQVAEQVKINSKHPDAAHKILYDYCWTEKELSETKH